MDIEEMFFQLRDKAEVEGAYTQSEWDGLVDELMEERIERGELGEEDDLEGLKDTLKARFEQFEESIPLM